MPLEATLRLAPIRSIGAALLDRQARTPRAEALELQGRRWLPPVPLAESQPVPVSLPREGGIT